MYKRVPHLVLVIMKRVHEEAPALNTGLRSCVLLESYCAIQCSQNLQRLSLRDF